MRVDSALTSARPEFWMERFRHGRKVNRALVWCQGRGVNLTGMRGTPLRERPHMQVVTDPGGQIELFTIPVERVLAWSAVEHSPRNLHLWSSDGVR